MSWMDAIGAAVLLVCTAIAGNELALSWAKRAARQDADQPEDDRSDTTPAPYVVGSEADPFAVDLARFRR